MEASPTPVGAADMRFPRMEKMRVTTAGVEEERVMENKLNLWEYRSILKPVGVKSERRSLRNGKIHEADEGCCSCRFMNFAR